MITGAIDGTWGLFHIGHLNLLSAAKEHCDKLIVFVNSDSIVMSETEQIPLIPEFERLSIIRACKYVDAAVIREKTNLCDVWREYKYDVHFASEERRFEKQIVELDAYMKGNGRNGVHFVPSTSYVSTALLVEKLKSNIYADKLSDFRSVDLGHPTEKVSWAKLQA
jgi:cytidyltransferase-like protein